MDELLSMDAFKDLLNDAAGHEKKKKRYHRTIDEIALFNAKMQQDEEALIAEALKKYQAGVR